MARKPSAAEVYETIRTRILAGDIRPGDHLREGALAEGLGLSRTPVREALRRLESDGLAVHEAHKGVVVAHLDHQAVTELYLIREVLEGTAAGEAARHASEAEIAALEDLLAPSAEREVAAAEASRVNRVFHSAIRNAAHNRFLVRTLDGLAQSMALLGPTTLGIPGRQDEAATEHAAIVAAIRDRAPEAAEAAARDHIRKAHRARLGVLYRDAR